MEDNQIQQNKNVSGIQINRLRKTFSSAGVIACDDVDLDIQQGELLVLLGPSGCGKTTTLRCVAGLETPDNDDAIIVRGRNLTGVAPKDRNLAFVFQTTALFPHINVRKNISFGLNMKKTFGREEIDHRVNRAAEMLKIQDLLDRYPRELSGGQGQRVALGRAMVMEPDAFLLDEPFAALDTRLRVEMRTEVKLIQRQLNTTMVFVTHDQEEALTIGDKIAVMNEGVVQQVDTPHNIYHRPKNRFVGNFIGSPPINEFDCHIEDKGDTTQVSSSIFSVPIPASHGEVARHGSGKICLGIRPEFVSIVDGPGDLTGTVKLNELMGSRTMILIDCQGHELRVLIQGVSEVNEGDSVQLRLDLERAFFFDSEGNSLV